MTDEFPALPEQVLSVAVARKRLVEVTYNKGRSLLAPHSVVTIREEPYLRAVTVARDGRTPRQPKLGTFKLSGLSDVAVTRRLFSTALFAAAVDQQTTPR
jgi:hypothetical protein